MTRPKITYLQYGGKTTLAKWIVGHFPPHRIYLEPFCGSCSVLFAKERSFVEIVNDLDYRIINMFEQVRSHPQELAALLWATPYSKSNWREVWEPDALEDARLLIAQGQQFYCGNGNTSTWAIDKSPKNHKPKNQVWADWFLRILPAAARLRDVQVLNEDAIKAIERVYQEPQALIYVDPPYVSHENEYRFKVEYARLVEVLRASTARVIVSEYPLADNFFPGWHRVAKTTAGKARTGRHNTKAKEKTEVLFMNFDPSGSNLQ